jgi:cytochrome c oxidase subunit 1
MQRNMLVDAQALPLQRYQTSVLRWLVTTNHKDIGLLYISASFLFFIVGGVEALVIRLQLAEPNSRVVSPEVYNQIFTMHGTTMIFLFAMPILVGFANYIVPLQLGARDMAFPRLNAMSFWLFLFGGLVLYSSFVLGGAPDAGWFAYAPLTGTDYSPTHGMDFWALGILMTGVGSTLGAINFVVTILNMRTRGMSMLKMPLFSWQILVTAILILFAMPALTVDAILLYFERAFRAPFFLAQQGGQPILWQHLFWFFGHPEVYILILPAFGIISEVVPVFSRRRIFGYAAIIYSGIAIGFLGFTVWAHHMFVVGLSPIADAIFSLDSMIIAVPTSIKIFNWVATMWGGRLNLKTPMLFAIGFISMFMIGGFSGITLATVPVDWQVTDTYYVVAHLHYVLFGGTVFAIFAGLYYWFPKMTGRFLSEKIGALQFWFMVLGFNLTFLPMHIQGLMGMPRRIYTYAANTSWGDLNFLETIGSFIIAIAVGIFLWNVAVSMRRGRPADGDPWHGHTLEWAVSSPPPGYNFAVAPIVHSRWPLLEENPGSVAEAHFATGVTDIPEETSVFPLVVAFGLGVAVYGLVYLYPVLILLGVAILFAGIVGLVYEPR